MNDELNTVEFGFFGIIISFYGDDIKGASIETDLHIDPNCSGDYIYNAAMDGIEAMILAQFSAGVDYMCPFYQQGIKDAVQACADNI